ncbi:MAG: serine/threonine protein kinase, partial [Thermoanaerobaculales bacterium]|nr:serine/threonine protein kinase [Thermoanaerobaculales bacterium]
GLVIAAVFNFSWVADRFQFDALPDSPLFHLFSNATLLVVANAVAGGLIVLGLVQLFLTATPQQRLVRTLLARGDLRGAAEMRLKEGDLKGAYSLFQKVRAWNEAAGVALQLGRDGEAAEFLRRAGGHNLGEASRIFRRSGNIATAQRCDRDFAEWLTSRGRYDEAVEAWMRAGEPKRAAGAAVIALDEGRFSSSHSALPAARRAVEQKGDHRTLARLHEVEGNWHAAAHAWRAAGEHARAAEIFRKAGMMHDAVIAESDAGHHKEAARLRIRQLEKLRDELVLVQTRGTPTEEVERLKKRIDHEEEALIPHLAELGMRQEMVQVIGSSGQAEEAVKKLVSRNEEAEAADLAINARLWHAAAPILERLNRWGEASDMYELAGDVEGAARCAERAGEDERALQLYRGLGAVDRTAHCMARLGYLQDALIELHRANLFNDALEVLQNHPGPVPDIPQIILDLAEWAKENRSHEAAIACLQRAVVGVALQPNRLGPAVALATEMDATGEHAAALAQVERILAFDFSCESARRLRSRINANRGDRMAQMAGSLGDDESGGSARIALQRFEILTELGRGGMGVVYKARDTRLERDVAIKVLRTTSNEEAARLGQEARAAATLNHPGIVTIHDFEAGFDGHFIAMEYVPGEPLDRTLKTNPVRIYNLLLRILQQVADAVAYAHDHHVIHRDLKPGNILLTPNDDVKILDFGIAARLESGDGNIATVCGTPFYMAPEQIRGEAPTPATDVYAFGATAFHLATGRPPFHKGDVIDAHLNTPPPNPMDLAPDLDPDLGRVILICMEKDPLQRFRDARQLCEALRALAP